RQVDNIVSGHLGPTVHCDLAVSRVQRNHYVARKCVTGVVQKARRLDGGRTDNDVTDTVVEVAFDGVKVPDATTELDGDGVSHRLHDSLDGSLVSRAPCERAVQIDQMQAPRTLLRPVLRHCARVFGKHRDLLHGALLQTDTMPVLKVNSRN